MMTGRASLNATEGHWLYGTPARDMDLRRPYEQDARSLSSAASRPLFNTLNQVDVFSNPATTILQVNTGGFGMPQSPISPLCSPRPILGCNDWNIPSTHSPAHRNGNTMDSPTGSDGSTFSSLDISDLMSSLSLSPPQRLFTAPTEQEVANLRALHTLTSSQALQNATALSPPPAQIRSQQLDSNRPWSFRDNIEHFNRCLNVAQSTASSGGLASWTGDLPWRFVMTPTYSCKVFLGGVPWDVTEEALVFLFMPFGRIRVEWPGKETSTTQPKGYVYIIFETENQVKLLLSKCFRDVSSGNYENYYFKIHSKKMKSKAVQVIPWRISDSNYVLAPSEKLDPHTTVFVGGLHGMLNAEGLFKIMNDLFGGVIYVGIDTDKFKYPIGSARVTFNNNRSYIQAVMAAFVEIKTSKFVKKVQINPYLEDAVCSNCVIHSGPYFCRELTCFRYFCPGCWIQQHQSEFFLGHKPLVRTSKYNSNISSNMRFAPH